MQVTKNAAYLFSARIVNALSIMALILIISRRLGPDIFGGYSFLNAVIMTAVVVATFGLDTLMVREVSRNPFLGNQFLSSVLGFKIISSLVVMAGVCALFGFFLHDHAMIKLLAVFSIAICLNSLSQSLWYYGDAFQKFQFHAILWAFSNVIKVPLVWFFVSLEPNLAMVVYALISAEVIALLISGYWIRLHFRLTLDNLSFKSMPPLFKKVWPLAVVFILSAVYFRIDMMMLEVMKGEKAVGIYSAAYKLIEFLSIIPGTVTVAALPGLSATFFSNMEGFKTRFYKTVMVLGAGGAAIGLLLYIFSNRVVLVLYGPLFSDSTLSLRILSGVVFFLFLNGYLAYVTIAADNEKAVVLILVISTILNILLNFYLIPRYSHLGAALATLLSEIFMLVFYIVLFAKTRVFLRQNIVTAELTDEYSQRLS
jgi:O-antigen/teichoic acid export membrane protein